MAANRLEPTEAKTPVGRLVYQPLYGSVIGLIGVLVKTIVEVKERIFVCAMLSKGNSEATINGTMTKDLIFIKAVYSRTDNCKY
jgi:hypothetical protein